MLTFEVLAFYALVVGTGVALWVLVFKRFLSADARDRRRRRKSYGKPISRRGRTAVKLASKAPRS